MPSKKKPAANNSPAEAARDFRLRLPGHLPEGSARRESLVLVNRILDPSDKLDAAAALMRLVALGASLPTPGERLLLELDVHTLAYLHTCDSLQEMRGFFDLLKELRERREAGKVSRGGKRKGGTRDKS